MRWCALALVLAGLMQAGHAQTTVDAPGATLRWLDRTTGDRQDIPLLVDKSAPAGSLLVTLKACRYPEGLINQDAYAFVEVEEVNLQQTIFAGWMIASSPGLNALEHPRYDLWVLRCQDGG